MAHLMAAQVRIAKMVALEMQEQQKPALAVQHDLADKANGCTLSCAYLLHRVCHT